MCILKSNLFCVCVKYCKQCFFFCKNDRLQHRQATFYPASVVLQGQSYTQGIFVMVWTYKLMLYHHEELILFKAKTLIKYFKINCTCNSNIFGFSLICCPYTGLSSAHYIKGQNCIHISMSSELMIGHKYVSFHSDLQAFIKKLSNFICYSFKTLHATVRY